MGAQHLQVSWDVIKDIQIRDLQHRYRKPRLGKWQQIAIDEIAIGHGYRYLTVVLNLETGPSSASATAKGRTLWRPSEATESGTSEDRSGGHRHVCRLHRGGP